MFSASKTSGPSGYNLTNSLRFRRSATAFLSRTPASVGNRRTFTWSGWVKRGLSGNNVMFQANQNSSFGQFSIGFDLSIPGDLGVYNQNATTTNLSVSTNALFRDFSAWYHIVVAVDTTQATAANRVLIYVNGVLQTTAIGTQVAQNTDLNCNNTIAHNIGREQTASGGAANYFDGYMTEINFVDGQALTPSSFGSTNATTGVWQPARYSGSYGTNGFYLNFTDIALTSGSNAGLGKDFSGNGNYWNTNNISVTAGTTYDAMIDSPTLTSATVANYCVLNPIGNNIGYSVTNGNLTIANGSTQRGTKPASFFVTSGKWYWEVLGNGYAGAVCGTTGASSTLTLSSTGSNGIGYWEGGLVYWDGGNSGAGPASYTSSDVIGIALNMDAGTVAFYKNNSLQYTATFGSGTVPNLSSGCFPCYNDGFSVAAKTANFNFGQRPFSYTPPTGFVALNTYNLPDSTIVKGNTVMDATLYTGNASTQTITNAAGFKPDFVWTKSRGNAYNHNLYNSISGINKFLQSNSTNGEATFVGSLTSFNSNGYTLGTQDNSNFTNGSAAVGWQWQAGQGSTSSNTSGTITSTVSVNATAGFSIVTYTGTGANATVGHGLGVAPKMIIVKVRSTTNDWAVYHGALATPATQALFLNLTNAVATTTTAWNSTSPTSSVFSIGTTGIVNASSATYVAYCWAEIAGFSAFGSYTGSGNTGASAPNANGPFIYTGFRPEFVLIKRTSSAADWEIFDSSRGSFNSNRPWLQPNLSNAETSAEAVDFLSNGFKIRAESGALMFPDGATFIYAAFAENPFKNALAR
jgi:hypothetical protein